MANFIRGQSEPAGRRRRRLLSGGLLTLALAGTGLVASGTSFATPAAPGAASGPLGAVADTYTTSDLGTLAVPTGHGVLANHTGGQLQIVSHTDPAHGSLTLSPDGSFGYVPQAELIGSVRAHRMRQADWVIPAAWIATA